MTQAKKKIILLTTGLILTICLMTFFGVYALTIAKNSTFNVGVKYEPEYLVKVEMGIDGANGGTVNKTIEDNEEDNEYVEIFNSLNPVSNGMYIQSMSNDTIHINSQTLTPIGANGDVYFKITSLENETSGKDLKCVIDCGSSTVDSGKLPFNKSKELIISTGLDSTNGTPASSSLGMIKINLKFSEFLLDLKYLVGNDETGIDLGEAGKIETNSISGTTFYVSDIDGLLKLSALVGKVDTTTTEYGSKYGYNNSAGSAVPFKGATIQMLNNIDCGNTSDFTNAKTFIPIGNATNSFQGTFDGNDKTITGLYINQTTTYAGLFGYVKNAEIKDLTMQNCKVVSTSYYVGNFVGYANNDLTISNCSAKETGVSGSSNVGGIVGYCNYNGTATITNCYNTGSVGGDGSSQVGGIVGYVDRTATITNCYNTGSVSGTEDVGGIVGYVDYTNVATITNCYNTGSVSGTEDVGGIVGYVNGRVITITNCYNTGSVSGSMHVGGIVGKVTETTITNCYNTGSVSGSMYVGGIIGCCEYSNIVAITNCYNTGSVGGSSSSRVGGIVGDIDDNGQSTITNCYNTGSVSGSSNVGGIFGGVGSNSTATITNCYNTGSVSSTGSSVGGIVGRVYGTATITNCYYLKTSSVKAIGSGTAKAGSYYGTFSSAESELTECDDIPSSEFAYGTTDLLTVLNAYVTDETSGLEIELTTWEIRAGENDGYPVFVITETVA